MTFNYRNYYGIRIIQATSKLRGLQNTQIADCFFDKFLLLKTESHTSSPILKMMIR